MSSETTKQVNVSECAPVELDQKAQPKMEANKDAGSDELNSAVTPLSATRRPMRAEMSQQAPIKAEKAARLAAEQAARLAAGVDFATDNYGVLAMDCSQGG